MSHKNPELPVDPIKLPQGPVEEIVAQVRAEYARFIEKRDAIRKASGRHRRSLLQSLLN